MKRCLSCGNVFQSQFWVCPACGKEPERHEGRLCFSPDLAWNNDGFNANEFGAYADLEGKNFWFSSRARLLTHLIGKYFPQLGYFFEIGCGTGFILSSLNKALPNAKLLGSDIYLKGLSFADRRLQGKTELFQMDACNIPFYHAFDAVGAFDVLEHIENHEKALEEICAAVRPGGGLVLTVPQHPFLWSAWDEMNQHKRRYASGELRKMVENEGFQILLASSFATLILPLVFLKRVADRHKKEMSFSDEAGTNPLINSACAAVMAVERGLIYSGLRFPLGSSSLVIARKPEQARR